MSKRQPLEVPNKKCGFEKLEDRRVFSGQSVAAIAVNTEVLLPEYAPELTQQVETTSDSTRSASQLSGADQVEQQYGFTGSGQTVAVIDSGIAWDHYALGGGYGENHRVVGGWDFAENDANPYDDGGAGYHGTHVTGIIGSSDPKYRGVSSGVDLVGLRVFDDSGGGNLEWVEQALQWVHEHKDDFENPITTVNLSLGTDWNADTVPNWATLEDEFAQLELDGIFVSVAAGNAFEDYNTAGLSYPAVSDHVVPVASHDAQGRMSDFSQRDHGVLVADGESIKSTVPDHLYGGTKTGQFAGSTGTSMASPIVAGASTLVRQAMEFMGHENINQDAIYDLFKQTADSLYDSVTGQTYHRLNLQAAIDSIVTDQHSDDIQSATNIGALEQGDLIRGTIGKLTDVDAFKFQASQTGRVTFDIQSSDDLLPNFQLHGGEVSVDGTRVSFDVVQGQTYEFTMQTSDGSGHYEISTHIVAGTSATQWGSVEQTVRTDIQIQGQETFQFSASRSGIMTLITQNADNGIQLKLYNQQMVELEATSDANGQIRFDLAAQQGQTFYLKAVGQGDFDVSLSNLVSLNNGNLEIHGTDSNDLIEVNASSQFEVQINSVNYRFNRDTVDSISVDTGAGADQLKVHLDDSDDQVSMGVQTVSIRSEQFSMTAQNTELNTIHSGGGQDRLRLTDSAGDDTFANQGQVASMISQGMANHGVGFNFVQAVSSAGNDTATLSGSEGNDKLVSKDGRVTLRSDSSTIVTRNFDQVTAQGNGGYDTSNLYDSAADDQFILRPSFAYGNTADGEVWANGFERVNAFASDGNDTIAFFDSQGDDRFHQHGNTSRLSNANHINLARGFDVVTVTSVGGNDLAQIYGTAASDTVRMDDTAVSLASGTFSLNVQGFERSNVLAGAGGNDVAFLTGTDGNDRIYADASAATFRTADGTTNRAVGFDKYHIDGKGGVDKAILIGSSGTDKLVANSVTTILDTNQVTFMLESFENQKFDGKAGFDVVVLSEFDEDDTLIGHGKSLQAEIDNTQISADNFSFLDAATDLVARYDMQAADYLFMLDGDWDETDFDSISQ